METKLESTVPASYVGSAQLNLGKGVTTATECCVVKIQRGQQGDLVGRMRSGKVVIFTYDAPRVEGYALAEITEEREKVAFGKLATLIEGVYQLHPVVLNAPARDAEDFLVQVRESIASAMEKRLREREKAADEKAARATEKERVLQLGRDLAGDAGEALVKALQGHDWWYAQSDCGATWRAGEAQRAEIETLLEKVGPADGKILWAEIAPAGFVRPR